jgi:hypothetical protein
MPVEINPVEISTCAGYGFNGNVAWVKRVESDMREEREMRVRAILLTALLVSRALGSASQYVYYDIWSSESEPQYLGWATPDSSDQYSIINPYGLYGSSFSMTSIRNEYGQYGSSYSMYSAYNPYASSPPALYLWNDTSQQWDFGAYITKNTTKYPRCDPDELIYHLQLQDGMPAGNDAPTLTYFGLSPDPSRPAEEVAFSVAATDPDGDLVTYSFDFGDGSDFVYGYGASDTVTHTYTNAGSYTLRLMLYDGWDIGFYYQGSWLLSGTYNVEVNDFPTLIDMGFNAYTTRVGMAVQFSSSGSDPEAQPVTYTWDPGDGSPTIESQFANHTYASPGRYKVSVKVSDSITAGFYYYGQWVNSIYDWLTVLPASPRAPEVLMGAVGEELELSWFQEPLAAYHLEECTDLATWRPCSATLDIRANVSGQQTARVQPSETHRFIRLLTTPQPPN